MSPGQKSEIAKWTKKSYDDAKMEEKILLPHTYLVPLRIYSIAGIGLPKAFNYWLNIPNDKLEAIQQMLVKLNNALAIQDDLMDESLYRRTRPSAHRVFGHALTFNSGIHLQFLALQDIINLGHPKGAELYCDGYLKFARGHGVSTYWRDHQICDVTLDDYYQMTIDQTGFLAVLTVQLMQFFSDNKTDYEYLANIFSIYYQIRDEYVDLKKPEAVEEGSRIPEFEQLATMTFCDDFSEGKFSVPVIHSLKSPQRDVILGILKMRTRDFKAKEYLLSLLEEAGGIQKTREIMRELEADIYAEIRRLGGNPVFEDLMRELDSWDERA